jgi:hypothetical protein
MFELRKFAANPRGCGRRQDHSDDQMIDSSQLKWTSTYADDVDKDDITFKNFDWEDINLTILLLCWDAQVTNL